jgi:5-methylcytosine-specific restriction endonuclease McrA
LPRRKSYLQKNNHLIHYLGTFDVSGNIGTAFQTLERYNHVQRELRYREVSCEQFELHSSTHDRIVILLGRRCIKCGSQYSLTLHHVVPKRENGSNGVENLQLLCKDCHSGIHDISRKEITIAGITGMEALT